jgi:hypothetical protein
MMQARKENNPIVLEKLEAVLKIAMEEKQKTLRPEIQLFNRLLAASTQLERQQVGNVLLQQHGCLTGWEIFGWQECVQFGLMAKSACQCGCGRNMSPTGLPKL